MSETVPTIDFAAGLDVPPESGAEWSPLPHQLKLAEEIIQAFRTVGFICLVNTGITQHDIDALITETKKFFNRDKSYKSEYTKGVMSNFGWIDIGRESLGPENLGDFKETFNYQPLMPESEVPDAMKSLRDWWDRCSSLSCQIMKLMGLGLGINSSIIADSHKFGSEANETAIRVNFYPKTKDKELPANQLRCGEHCDYGSITLLVQDSQGLEVMNRSTGSYESVVAPPGGVVVNIGDVMQFWTSDELLANKHRVLVADDPELQAQDRVSIPFFAMPDQHTIIECLIGKNKYPSVTMRDWLKKKIDAAFPERQNTTGDSG